MADSPPSPASTKSTWILLAVVGLPALVFIVAGITRFEPVLKVFHWLALIL